MNVGLVGGLYIGPLSMSVVTSAEATLASLKNLLYRFLILQFYKVYGGRHVRKKYDVMNLTDALCSEQAGLGHRIHI